MNIQLFTYNQVPNTSVIVDILISSSGIIIPIILGWFVYLKQQRNKQIKETVISFNLILSYIIVNLDIALSMQDKVNCSIKDLN